MKYADLIDNTTASITEHDRSFAKVYLQEMKQILDLMRSGHIDLLIRCSFAYYDSVKKAEESP